MADMTKTMTCEAPPEQIKYANLLFWGSWLGIFLMIITYLIYITGVLQPAVSMQDVTSNWTQPRIKVTSYGPHHEIEEFKICGKEVECSISDPDVVGGVAAYSKITNSPTGWDWAKQLGKGDFLNFLPIAFLAVLTIICYFTLIPAYFRCKEYVYAGIVIAEIIVLAAAASGLVGGGAH
ncbi:DUF1634 domain-containing protein [Oceanidesulfovibrio indonesiensis]|uniref:DUF1634 domain-containing protein n=1 Tax=Oceanidesulfovibrio indonesiensis TaxID=54767 RepID=A0A7M3MIA0_9BACT|nr:DUF1634 domain-containing protein [Oceanidesulfovibrio indonesiensis]TVM19424.1 DUF1634 domain-containing protein [Oceanidesulfovibrio indonesiensis]